MVRVEQTRIERAGITETTDLGMAMVIAEAEDGTYEPVAMAINIREAREMANYDLQDRMRKLESAIDTMCPERYAVWARDATGEYRRAATFEME